MILWQRILLSKSICHFLQDNSRPEGIQYKCSISAEMAKGNAAGPLAKGLKQEYTDG